jgi:hypothetical protein
VADEADDADSEEDHPERNGNAGMMKRTSQARQDHHDADLFVCERRIPPWLVYSGRRLSEPPISRNQKQSDCGQSVALID